VVMDLSIEVSEGKQKVSICAALSSRTSWFWTSLRVAIQLLL